MAVHAAIIGPNDVTAVNIVEHLIKTHPDYLEAKNIEEKTPLAVAAELGRLNLVKILLDNGADQSANDKPGNNIVHLALECSPKTSPTPHFPRGSRPNATNILAPGAQRRRHKRRPPTCARLGQHLRPPAALFPGERRLVGLHEVSERIGLAHQGSRHGWEGVEGKKTRNRLYPRAGRVPMCRADADALPNGESKEGLETGDFVSNKLPDLRRSAWEEPRVKS